MSTTFESINQRVRAVAQEYRDKGYEVIENPSENQLPAFLSGYRPDLFVKGETEKVIVEVTTRSTMAGDSSVRELSRLLRSKPGWRFELILVGEQEKLDTPENAISLDKSSIKQRVREAEGLLELGSTEAAFILVWSAAEALIRTLTSEEELVLERIQPSYILKIAVSNGIIARDDYNFLANALKYRNALVHGFYSPDLTTDFTRELIQITGQLLIDSNSPSNNSEV